MPETTLTINHAGGGSETYTINRDKFEGIRNMTVDGATVSVDHTPAADLRNLLVDADNVTIDRAHGGEIRTLFIDGVEVTIDRTGEVIVEGFLTLFPNAAAAYSLQRLNGHQALINARRGSDNAEVDVYPDSSANREVSADSPITVTSGSSSATTFGEFLTENVTIYNSDYSAGTEGWFSAEGNVDGNIDGIGGRDDNLRFTSTASNVGVNHYSRRSNTLEVGQTYNVTFDFYIPSSNNRLDEINAVTVGGDTVDVNSLSALDQWVSVSVTSTTPAINPNIVIRWEDSSESGDATGDVAYIRNVTITQTSGNDAFVTTWYDQAGSNDASQSIDDAQPKIAENGSVLADGIDFLSGRNLTLSGTGLDIFRNVSYGQIFSVIKPRETSTSSNRYFEAKAGAAIGARFLFGDGQDVPATFRIGGRSLDGDSFGDEESPTSHNNELSLMTGFLNYTDAEGFLFLNGTQVATNSIPNMTVGNTPDTSSSSVTIGGAVAGNTSPFNAKELIIYTTDQSSNRAAIEANINGRYSIY